MTSIEFKKLLFETAFSIIICDGEIHDDELKVFKEMVSGSIFFEEIDYESELKSLILDFKVKGVKTIYDLIDRIAAAKLTSRQELILVEILVKMAEADSKHEKAEIDLISRIKEKLSIKDEDLILKFPRHVDLLVDIGRTGDSSLNKGIVSSEFDKIEDLFR